MSCGNRIYPAFMLCVLLGSACSSNGTSADHTGSGGAAVSSGGAAASGGMTTSGGAIGTGGIIGSGGTTSSGGTVGTGGVTSAGGAGGTSGATTTTGVGGRAGNGGGSGGTAATGGRLGQGGSSAGTGGSGGGAPPTGGSGNGGTTAARGGSTGRGGAGGAGGTSTSGQGTGGSTGAGGDPVKSDGCGKTPSLKSGNGLAISVSGTSRTYNLTLPDSYDNTHPYRMILSYHALSVDANSVTNGEGNKIKPYYGLLDQAQGSTIFVAPQGTGNAWSNSGGADVEFSRQLITTLQSELCIDKARVFCEGHSMGGSMSYAMACGASDLVRAVAIHSGGTMSGCSKTNRKPVAYFMTHGTQDTICNYMTAGIPILQDYAKLDGCTNPDPSLSSTAFEALLPEPTSTAGACTDFTGCQQGYPVRACIFVGGHTPSPDGNNGWVPKESWKFITQF